MRIFIAIEIPEEIKKKLEEAQALLMKSGAEASWTRPEGMHLTLIFLGEVQETMLDGIAANLSQALEGMQKFRLAFTGSGVFPHARNPRVVWIGVAGERDKLMALQLLLEERIVRLGFKREDRSFTPHLTLGRIKAIRSRESWLKALEEVSALPYPDFEVTAVSVMKSELKPTGAVYAELGRVKLK